LGLFLSFFFGLVAFCTLVTLFYQSLNEVINNQGLRFFKSI
jgi:hypothetical protein